MILNDQFLVPTRELVFLPHYPLLALLVTALDVAVIWAVATQGELGGADR